MKTRLAPVIQGALGVLEPLVDLEILVVLVVLGLHRLTPVILGDLEPLVDLGAPALPLVLGALGVQVVHSALSGKIPASNFVPAYGTP